ncbi:MAG: hypothetical protein UW11_C0039G0004 [Parcubacteria group bacterium GW2011_GWA2_43_9b]|nr:MAG: hypothetical protein UW11_C0039G0004 [Parcubacteria group bacterium GW2011_GWA2_43_9b]
MSIEQKNNGIAWWQPALTIFAKFSGWIFGPLFLGLFLGNWLDRKFNTGSIWLLICVGAAFIISVGGLLLSAREEFKKLSNDKRSEK